MKRQNEILAKDDISEGNTEYKVMLTKSLLICVSEDHLPFFPSINENITVSFGSKAVLKCEVENLKNYKVLYQLLRN